jgi:hypothetical protein
MRSWEVSNDYAEALFENMNKKYGMDGMPIYVEKLKLFLGNVMINLQVYHPDAFQHIKNYIDEKKEDLQKEVICIKQKT